MATFDECKIYFRCKQKETYSDDDALRNAIKGEECKSHKGKKGEQGTGNLERCRSVCTHFTNIEESDKLKMCRLTFKLSEEVAPAMVKFKDKVEYSTLSFDGSDVFTPIVPKTYIEYRDIFDKYFQLFTLDILHLLKEVDEDFYNKLLLSAFTFGYPNFKGILLNHKDESHKKIIDKINKLKIQAINKLKNNKTRDNWYAKQFRHTSCNKKGALLEESNPPLICKKSKKPKRFDPCKGKMCWYRKGPGDSIMYYSSIKKAKKYEQKTKNLQKGGNKKNKTTNKSSKFRKTNKIRKTRKNRKTIKY